MTWIATAALALFLVQELQPQTPAQPAATGNLDLVVLQSGERLEGRLVTETQTYVEIELEAGSTVGFSRAQVSSVQHGAGRPADATARRGRFRPRDSWYVLHDGDGAAVGWLHETLSLGDGGGLRLLEEWEFVFDAKKVAVTMLEITDDEHRPVSCYFRERNGVDGRPHVLDERIVEARIEQGALMVKRMTGDGTERRSYSRPDGLQFPLLAREKLRLGLLTAEEEVLLSLFDPSTEELAVRSFHAGRPRHVRLDGQGVQVIEVSAQTAAGRNFEWLDSSGLVLRREINGPALVARPSTEAVAKGSAGVAKDAYPSSLLVEVNKRFGLWLPNPTWDFEEEQVAGQVAAHSALHEAWVSLVLLEHLDDGVLLESAADVVGRWHRLLHPGYRTDEQSTVSVRGRPAVRIEGRARHGRSTSRSVVHVIEHRGSFLALTWMAPDEHYDDLAADFDQILRRVELDPEGIEPQLSGPVK